jgi:AhpD family alkylhydroperoxidase
MAGAALACITSRVVVGYAASSRVRPRAVERYSLLRRVRMGTTIRGFREERERLNAGILEAGHLGIDRFFALDAGAYRPGALDTRTKELLGLVASTVLRCDDCITHHLIRCVEEGHSDDEIVDGLNVALVIGGSIVIPHLRRAMARLEEIRRIDDERRA